LKAAKAIVAGKMANMIVFLQRIGRSKKSSDAKKAVNEVKNLLAAVAGAASLESLRGLEGRAAACYFSGLRGGLEKDLGFRKRVRRPPTDPVNSVLSLLYTFLLNRVFAAVRITGLDPYPGVLHTLDYGRCSLPLDLIEEFRTPVADTLTVSLFNLGVLQEKDFYQYEPPSFDLPEPEKSAIDQACADPLGRMGLPEETEEITDLSGEQFPGNEEGLEEKTGKAAIRLFPEAFRKLLIAFEKKLQTEFFQPQAEKRMTYAEALVFQARQYRRLVEGEISVYSPFLLR
jgi:CRISPR-associated protein Cas1